MQFLFLGKQRSVYKTEEDFTSNSQSNCMKTYFVEIFFSVSFPKESYSYEKFNPMDDKNKSIIHHFTNDQRKKTFLEKSKD